MKIGHKKNKRLLRIERLSKRPTKRFRMEQKLKRIRNK